MKIMLVSHPSADLWTTRANLYENHGLRILGLHPGTYIFWLVVEPPLSKMSVSWDDDIPNIWTNKKCSKPPTSLVLQVGQFASSILA